jgi:BirA family biotin operon repressor/biotin-[acetyl-CoA-carboxylase] ligase
MLSTSELERALEAAGLHAPVRFEEVTGSTNATAQELAEEGSPEWTLVAANHQTAGRGRMGRTWVDRPGGALMCSFVLRPVTLDPASGGLIPLLAGASMAEAAGDVAGIGVRCKWPNDLLFGRAKVGGVLVESAIESGRFRYMVVGVGVNLELPPDMPGAAGLGPVDPACLLTAFLRRFGSGYLPADDAFAAIVRERWRAVSATLGSDVEANGPDGSTVRGRAIDVDAQGGLVIETVDGPTTVVSGEVWHLTGD